jgi:hypothetical protein
MIDNKKLREIIRYFLGLEKKDLFGYYCKNEVQELSRLGCFYEDYEVQINEIVHSKVPHYHGVDMTSFILRHGYTWFLQQHNSESAIELYAAPGSIIRMGLLDKHWIPEHRMGLRSVSMCIFQQHSDWHKHYPKLSDKEFNHIYECAILPLAISTDRMKRL